MGPPDALEQHGHFSDHMFREFATFLVEKYDAIVIDGGRAVSDEVVLAAAQVSASVFLVIDQEFPSIRNAQRYITFLMRMGFNQDQIRVVVNRYSKKVSPNMASARADPADAEPAGVLRHSRIAGGDRLHQQGAPVRGQPRTGAATWTASSARLWTRPPAAGRAAKIAVRDRHEHGDRQNQGSHHGPSAAMSEVLLGSRSLVRPGSAPTAGSKSRARSITSSLNSLTPDQLRDLNKDSVRGADRRRGGEAHPR